MHRYFFITKDAFISSGSDTITGEDFKDKNTGQDEILELKKVFFDRGFHYPTRVLLQFDTDETGAGLQTIAYPGADDDKLTITNIQNCDLTFTATTTTNYHVTGYAASTDTATAFGDQ